MVFAPRLRAALEKLNPKLPAGAIAAAMEDLTRDRTAMAGAGANREAWALIRDGVKVQVPDRERGAVKDERVRVVDRENPGANHFLLASQMTVTGQLYTCRPYLVGFVNGLPWVVIELKKPGVPARRTCSRRTARRDKACFRARGSSSRMKKSPSSKQWLRRHVEDPYVQRSKREGYRSRSAYKLLEIDERDKLLKPGMVVVDLGAAPGGWSQVLAKRAGAKGFVVAIDLLEMGPIPGVTFIQGDFGNARGLDAVSMALGGRPADLVLSDLSPNLSGIAFTDQARSMALAEAAFEFAIRHLKPGGAFLVKVFQGVGYEEFLRPVRMAFDKVVVRKPAASRGESAELYLLARGLRNEA